jgi:hypothetical protein
VSKAVFRPMTPLEIQAARALGACRFTPGSSTKRIARTIAAQVVYACERCGKPRRGWDGLHSEQCECGARCVWAGRITEKQAAVLWRLCHSYRRQITDERVLEHAEAVRSGRVKLEVAAALEATIDKTPDLSFAERFPWSLRSSTADAAEGIGDP